MPNHLDEIDALLSRLAQSEADDAGKWREIIQQQLRLTQATTRKVVFMGEVGVGKSSALAVTTHLLLDGEPPKDKSSLRKQSLLTTGAGRTTLCEVLIRGHEQGENSQQYGLLLEPLPLADINETIHLWAEDEWSKRQPDHASGASGEAPSNSQEITRALRNMAGYAERHEFVPSTGNNAPQRRTINPLDGVVAGCDSLVAFEQHVLEKIRLTERNQTSWWLAAETGRRELKELLEQINNGLCRTASLPQRVTLVVPGLAENAYQQQLHFIDSRGLDAGAGLSVREDLQRFIEDPLAVYVLCAPFNSAPGEAVRELLREINGDARWIGVRQRLVLTLLDRGDADQVNGADGNRVIGQGIKVQECLNDLQQANLIPDGLEMAVLAFDVLADPSAKLLNFITEQINRLNQSAHARLNDLRVQAGQYLSNVHDKARRALLPSVDTQIKQVLRVHLPEGVPMSDPMSGALNAVLLTRYPSVVYAACRRRGRYWGLDLHEAIKSGAANAATAWITPPVNAVIAKLDELMGNDAYRSVLDDLELRKLRFKEGQISFVDNYALGVRAEVVPLLEKDKQLWIECRRHWGAANGFKQQVHDSLRRWSERQVLKAHMAFEDKTGNIPFWSAMAPPVSAPRFVLHVKNLRTLRHAVFDPEPVSLLIGANGAGKTTLLHALKLLRLAYERGVREAIRMVMEGTYGLKNWLSKPEDTIELRLTLGDSEWVLQLPARDGGLERIQHETLTHHGQVIFKRDPIQGLEYLGTPVTAKDETTALKTLVDRGEIHPAIQQVSDLLQRMAVFEEPDLFSLRKHGSPALDDQQLHGRGQNVLSVLRRWQQEKQSKYRFDFVLQGLQAAFPKLTDIDFDGMDNVLTARVYHQGVEHHARLAHEANGVLQMLVLLANVAQADPGGVVAIDEPENGLHPYAMRMFLRGCQQWALKYRVTFVLATHSLVLLDEFTGTPEAVFVMKALDGSDVGTVPNTLDQLCDRDWLEGFKLGDLYEQGEIGSNEDGQ